MSWCKILGRCPNCNSKEYIHELKDRSVCLIPKKEAKCALTCHEYDYCRCDINYLLSMIDQLKKENKELKECVEYYASDMKKRWGIINTLGDFQSVDAPYVARLTLAKIKGIKMIKPEPLIRRENG